MGWFQLEFGKLGESGEMCFFFKILKKTTIFEKKPPNLKKNHRSENFQIAQNVQKSGFIDFENFGKLGQNPIPTYALTSSLNFWSAPPPFMQHKTRSLLEL